MKNQLDKIIYFVKNTGDKVIVLKDDSEFVVIPLDDYEGLFHHKKQLASMSEEEMLSRINRDIALWRESQKEFIEEDEDDYYKTNDLEDEDFYYNNHLNNSDDKWVEPDWQGDDDDDDDYNEPVNFSSVDEFELSAELSTDSDWPENKKGLDDVALPLKEEKVIEPIIQPQTPKKRVNNFGHPNPPDTNDLSQVRSSNDSYDQIVPPPSR